MSRKSTLWSSSRWRTRFDAHYFFNIAQSMFVTWFLWNLSFKVEPNVLAVGFCGFWSLIFAVLTVCNIVDIDTIHGMVPVYRERVGTRLFSLYIPENLFKNKGYGYLSEFDAALSLLRESLNQYVTTVHDTQWSDSDAFQLVIEKVSEVETMLRDEHVVAVLLLEEDTPGRSEIVNSVVSKIYDAAEFIEQATKKVRRDYEDHMTSEATHMIDMIFPSSCEVDKITFESPSAVEDSPIWKNKETDNNYASIEGQ